MSWQSTPIPGGWSYAHADSDARIIVDYISPRGSGLEAWVELRTSREIPVASGQINIMSPRAAQPFLAEAGETQIPWAAGLHQAFYEVVEAWRAGAATLDLATVEVSDMMFILDPLVELGGNTRLIAPGGSGKSLMADAVALTVSTGSSSFLGLKPEVVGPVMYLDWETNAITHARRVRALCKGADVPPPSKNLIWYRYEGLPLYKSMQAVTRAVRRAEAVVVVVDSRMMAAGASGQSSGEDSTLNLNTALREIGVPALIVDHKSKEYMDKGKKGGYGSVFNTNLARLEWEYDRYTKTFRDEETIRTFIVALEKENNVGELPPLGFRLTTAGGKHGITSARFEQVPVTSIADPAEIDIVGERVWAVLTAANETMTIRGLERATGVSASSLRSHLNRDTRYENVNADRKGAQGRWRIREGVPRDEGTQEGFDSWEGEPVGGPVSDWREGDEVF